MPNTQFGLLHGGPRGGNPGGAWGAPASDDLPQCAPAPWIGDAMGETNGVLPCAFATLALVPRTSGTAACALTLGGHPPWRHGRKHQILCSLHLIDNILQTCSVLTRTVQQLLASMPKSTRELTESKSFRASSGSSFGGGGCDLAG